MQKEYWKLLILIAICTLSHSPLSAQLRINVDKLVLLMLSRFFLSKMKRKFI